MKQLLFSSILMATVAVMLHSCQSTDVYNPDQKMEDVVAKYKQNFLNYVGGSIAENQTWGFDATKLVSAPRRANVVGDGYELSDTYIKRWSPKYWHEMLDSLPDLTNGKTLKPTLPTNYEFLHRGKFRFDIVYSYTSQNAEIGYYWYNPDTEDFNAVYKSRMKKLVNKFTDDHQNTYHYFQFSYYSNPTEDKDQWEDMTAAYGYRIFDYPDPEVFWFHSRMFTLTDVPEGSYVGFYLVSTDRQDTIFTNRNLNKDQSHNYCAVVASEDKGANLSNTYLVGMEDLSTGPRRDYGCNDIMIAVHRYIEGSEKEEWPLLVTPKKYDPTYRIIAEDLNITDNGNDFDFNDIVLDVKLTTTGADCTLRAAGATLPIRINGQNDLEVHKLFGVDQDVMVNTNAEKLSGAKGKTVPESDLPKFKITGSFKSAKDVKIEVNRGTTTEPMWVELFADTGQPACKIAVTTKFVWPDERQSIKAKYPKFTEWVQDPSVVWY